MAGGRRVEHDDVVRLPPTSEHRIDEGEHPEQLVEPGRGKVDQLTNDVAVVGDVEARAAQQRVEDLVDGGAIALAPPREGGGGVELARGQPGQAGHRPLVVAERQPEGVAERMRGIRRQHEDARVGTALGQREADGRRRGGLADAALAGEREHADARRRERVEPGRDFTGRRTCLPLSSSCRPASDGRAPAPRRPTARTATAERRADAPHPRQPPRLSIERRDERQPAAGEERG